MLFSSVVSQLINTWPNKKILDYGYFEQIKDILPCILLVTIMSILVYGVSFLNIPDILILFIQVPLGAFIYICGSILFHFECYEYVFSVLKNFIKK